jgi:hypothetical protein
MSIAEEERHKKRCRTELGSRLAVARRQGAARRASRADAHVGRNPGRLLLHRLHTLVAALPHVPRPAAIAAFQRSIEGAASSRVAVSEGVSHGTLRSARPARCTSCARGRECLHPGKAAVPADIVLLLKLTHTGHPFRWRAANVRATTVWS